MELGNNRGKDTEGIKICEDKREGAERLIRERKMCTYV